MLCIEIFYLTDHAVARDRYERARPEWPPHPARLFSALVAAWGERLATASEEDADHDAACAERSALEWIEQLPVPAITAEPNPFQRGERPAPIFGANSPASPVEVFVPPTPAQGKSTLPGEIGRKPRFFPTLALSDPRVCFTWPTAGPDDLNRHRAALDRLVGNLTCLGHSSALVAGRLVDTEPSPTWTPHRDGEFVLRVPARRRIRALIDAHGHASKDVLLREAPEASVHSYRRACEQNAPPPRVSLFAGTDGVDAIVFRLADGPVLPGAASLRLAAAVRGALMSVADQPPHPFLTGHEPDGARLSQPHLAIAPLLSVGHPYADGHILGFALILPNSTPTAARRIVLTTAFRLGSATIALGTLGSWALKRTVDPQQVSLRISDPRYCGPSAAWATATPIVFDRFPKDPRGTEAQSVVALACRHIGLPDPLEVRLGEISALAGSPPSFRFPTLSTSGKPIYPLLIESPSGRRMWRLPSGNSPRLRAHAVICFPHPVRGPIILGAGRYFGLGLCHSIASLGIGSDAAS